MSCDIVGHSSEPEHTVQLGRIAQINQIVARTIRECGREAAVWASGGDGGHVVFRFSVWADADWRGPVLDLITRLRQWSLDRGVSLRITAHVGPVTHIRGADGRIQIIGHGINTAGWMLSRGAAGGVVVSRAFREAFGAYGASKGVRFAESRLLRTKSSVYETLMLMSIGSDTPRWDRAVEKDRERLAWSLQYGTIWDVLLFAKRILQVSNGDDDAIKAFLRLPQRKPLTYANPERGGAVNPFFAGLDDHELRDIVLAGQLVERQYDEVICSYGEKGDTMFVILRGQVSVDNVDGEGSTGADASIPTLQEGEIVGELAFALGGRRTADLVARTDVVLLSFNYREITRGLGQTAADRVARFITSRVLEHVSRKAPYLLGRKATGPLSLGGWSAEDTLAMLEEHCELITVAPSPHHDFAAPTVEIPTSRGAGIYILAAGNLRSSGNPDNDIGADGFPLLWINLPGEIVLPYRSFAISGDTPVRILHIKYDGIVKLEAVKRTALYPALRLAASACFDYDAFISYNGQDQKTAEIVESVLAAGGLRVFLDRKNMRGAEFTRRLQNALRSTRAMVPLISPHVMAREPAANWVKRELEGNAHYYDDQRIFPLMLPGGRHDNLVSGYPGINLDPKELADGSDERRHELLRDLYVDLVNLRDGRTEPPYARDVKPELRLV